MSEVVVVGSFVARDGEKEARAAFEGLVSPTHAEGGCILYALHQGHDDRRTLAFVERWASKKAIDAQLDSEHVKAVLAKADDLFARADITVDDPVPGGEERKGSLAAHAGG
jgi:quinol monooxygenase YgiN